MERFFSEISCDRKEHIGNLHILIDELLQEKGNINVLKLKYLADNLKNLKCCVGCDKSSNFQLKNNGDFNAFNCDNCYYTYKLLQHGKNFIKCLCCNRLVIVIYDFNSYSAFICTYCFIQTNNYLKNFIFSGYDLKPIKNFKYFKV